MILFKDWGKQDTPGRRLSKMEFLNEKRNKNLELKNDYIIYLTCLKGTKNQMLFKSRMFFFQFHK